MEGLYLRTSEYDERRIQQLWWVDGKPGARLTITIDHPNFGAAWRQADYDFLTSETCARLLEKHNITLMTWREIRNNITRAERRPKQ